ncbi:succinyldiaminopimelate aminotransferase [Haloactinopolyspora alba]|uniref:Aminotransferase n=1 Tax=Haloactinopolyspora alba TaxID=648780 RepID=A0A2P8DX90_9ACTN|nr:succinyldiaminopimelate transaminase [Haloactinopolyspora alba]PSL01840.1 succinyldiaminopimelate aminotransferase [Haloactinopolyspora alba]
MPQRRRLPDFPWDALVPYRERAAAHPGGVVDLSVGTPVDPTPDVVQQALRSAADAPGYPATAGTSQLRAAAVEWLRRRCGLRASGGDPGVLPTIGSKELVAWLPTLLGVGAGDVVVHPELAYPSYDVGARLAGAEPVAADAVVALGPRRVGLVWVNSPANPHGRVLPAEHLAKVVAWARERGAVVASDECYLEFGWDARPVSVLDSDVNGGSLEGILAVQSLSKRSNMAGYRAGLVAGDPAIVRQLLEVRKHAGMMMPAPVQEAMAAALADDEHVEVQRERYRRRRASLRTALAGAGFRVDDSEAGLYLWATRDEGCWDTVDRLAQLGILVAPGEFYGPLGARHVRVALTAVDERVDAAVKRLA